MRMRFNFRSLRTELIVYAILSMGLTVCTEIVLGVLIYLISMVLGISYYSYNINPEQGNVERVPIQHYPRSADGISDVFDYESLHRMDRRTLFVIMVVIVVASLSLFTVYFLLFVKKIIRDMSYISDSIAHIATGDMSEQIELDRQDELGEIAKRINEMQAQLNLSMASEREALQTHKDLIACVAHDLRTPITSVMGYLDLAMDTEHHPVEERQRYAAIALQKSERLEHLIQDLFSYTKLMSGEITLHRSRIDLVQLVEQMTEEFYPIFQDYSLECSFESNVTAMEMSLDGELIARAVQNLLSNASKYGQDGKQSYVKLEKLEHEVQISVTNFGQIIPEESLHHIFDKFYRVEGSRSTHTGGTGLGLNIAYEITRLHGGMIQVASDIQGTRFIIALPIVQQEAKGGENSEKKL